MNNDRRKALAAVVKQLEAFPDLDELQGELETILDDEQEAFDNLPESLQQGERGQTMEAAINAMQEAIDMLDCFSIEELTGHLETASE
jgi:hypothetical protein